MFQIQNHQALRVSIDALQAHTRTTRGTGDIAAIDADEYRSVRGGNETVVLRGCLVDVCNVAVSWVRALLQHSVYTP